MPKSRNRKRFAVQNAGFKFPSFEKFIKILISCKTCGNERQEVEFINLPNDIKLGWILEENCQKDDILLYCKCCEEYTAIS